MKRHAFFLIVAGVLALGCSTTETGNDARDASDAPVESRPDLAIDATPDATPDVAPDVTPDVAPDVTPDRAPDVTPDAIDASDATDSTDVTADATDARLDAVPDGMCPLSCGAEQYCRYTYTTDAGCGTVPSGGAWTCVNFPAACGTGAQCNCLAGCACCKMISTFAFTCAGV